MLQWLGGDLSKKLAIEINMANIKIDDRICLLLEEFAFISPNGRKCNFFAVIFGGKTGVFYERGYGICNVELFRLSKPADLLSFKCARQPIIGRMLVHRRISREDAGRAGHALAALRQS